MYSFRTKFENLSLVLWVDNKGLLFLLHLHRKAVQHSCSIRFNSLHPLSAWMKIDSAGALCAQCVPSPLQSLGTILLVIEGLAGLAVKLIKMEKMAENC